MKHLWSFSNKQNGYSVRFGVVKLCPTEMSHSQLWRPLLDYRWKTEGNNAPFGSIFQCKNRPFNDCFGNIFHRRSDIESGKFTSVKGLSSNRRAFRMTSARF